MPNNISRQQNFDRPIYLTPSNVRVIEAEPIEIPTKNGFFVGKISPTDSVTASTTIGVPTEFPSTKSKEDNILNGSKKKQSVGERICYKIFSEFVASKMGKKNVMQNIRPNFLKNPKTNYNLELDMFEAFDLNVTNMNDIKDGIAIEYNGIQHDKFTPAMHKDYDAFLYQKWRDNYKASVCKEKGIILIIVDTSIDLSRIQVRNSGKKKFINFTEDEREHNIREYLIPKLEEAYNQLMSNRQ